jgi:hypothetical protein
MMMIMVTITIIIIMVMMKPLSVPSSSLKAACGTFRERICTMMVYGRLHYRIYYHTD